MTTSPPEPTEETQPYDPVEDPHSYEPHDKDRAPQEDFDE